MKWEIRGDTSALTKLHISEQNVPREECQHCGSSCLATAGRVHVHVQALREQLLYHDRSFV